MCLRVLHVYERWTKILIRWCSGCTNWNSITGWKREHETLCDQRYIIRTTCIFITLNKNAVEWIEALFHETKVIFSLAFYILVHRVYSDSSSSRTTGSCPCYQERFDYVLHIFVFTLWTDEWMDGCSDVQMDRQKRMCEQIRWCLCNIPIYLLIPLASIRDWSNAVGHNTYVYLLLTEWAHRPVRTLLLLLLFRCCSLLWLFSSHFLLLSTNRKINTKILYPSGREFAVPDVRKTTEQWRNAVQHTHTQASCWCVIILCR